jgi:DNA (cytosine-5)-methyltransferase 1
MRFVDLFAGLGGFHRALGSLGHECVYACELDEELGSLYKLNFPQAARVTFGDIRSTFDRIPPHEILCAGFPCQPFSKSGSQTGALDKARGTLFADVVRVLDRHRPEYVFLENVGNYQRHDGGRTWQIARDALLELGYYIQATAQVATGGTGLLSPHHLGYPHTRERFFVVGRRTPWDRDVFPSRRWSGRTTLTSILQDDDELTPLDRLETRLSDGQHKCIEHWNAFLHQLPGSVRLPSFPLWGDELSAIYPYIDTVPANLRVHELQRVTRYRGSTRITRSELLQRLPAYARDPGPTFPNWKAKFIRQNRTFWRGASPYLSREWRRDLRAMPASFRKLEWNCQGEERDLWQHVLQFRPSGLRVKRMTSSPALVAMTSTQIPVVGPAHRFLTRVEGLRLQDFGDDHLLPLSRADAFRALGNAVHVGLVRAIATSALLAAEGHAGQQRLALEAS